MKTALNMNTKLSRADRMQEGCGAQSERILRTHDSTDITETQLNNQAVAKWVSAGVKRSGKMLALAVEAGVSHQFLSLVCKGEKAFSPKLLVSLFQDREFFLGFVAAAGEELHGLAEPKAKRKVSRAETDRAIAKRVRQIAFLWKSLRPDIAADLETTEDDLEAVGDVSLDLEAA